jgi:excisionase family DNA binding protein
LHDTGRKEIPVEQNAESSAGLAIDAAVRALAGVFAESLAQELRSLLSERVSVSSAGPVPRQGVDQRHEARPDLPLTVSVEEAAAMLGIGRGSAYEAVRRGQIPAVRIGRRIRIPSHRLVENVDGALL